MPSKNSRKRKAEENAQDNTQPPSHENLVIRSMWNKPEFSDLTITFSTKSIAAHKSILASSSPIFHALLTSNPTTTTLPLENDCPIALELCLKWAYGYPYPSTSPNIELHFLSASCAEKYGLVALKNGVLALIDMVLRDCHIEVLVDVVLKMRFAKYCGECEGIVRRYRDERMRELFSRPRFGNVMRQDMRFAGRVLLERPDVVERGVPGMEGIVERVVDGHDEGFAVELLEKRVGVEVVSPGRKGAFEWFREVLGKDEGRRLLRGDKGLCKKALLTFLL